MGTCYWESVLWEPCLETCSWEPLLGNLFFVLGNFAWEPVLGTQPVPGNFGHADLGCSDLRQAVYYGFRVWEKQLFEATSQLVLIRFRSGSGAVPI